MRPIFIMHLTEKKLDILSAVVNFFPTALINATRMVFTDNYYCPLYGNFTAQFSVKERGEMSERYFHFLANESQGVLYEAKILNQIFWKGKLFR